MKLIVKFVLSCIIVPLLCVAYIVFYALLSFGALLVVYKYITGKIGASFFNEFGTLIMWFLMLYPLLGAGFIGIINYLQDRLYWG